MRWVSTLILHAGETAMIGGQGSLIMNNPVFYNQENRNTYISLPLLFNLPQENVRHDIVLKNSSDEDDCSIEGKIVLLSTEVEYETEIPEEEIYPVPKIFINNRFSAVFSGMQFYNFPASCFPVLLLNPEKLIQNIYLLGSCAEKNDITKVSQPPDIIQKEMAI